MQYRDKKFFQRKNEKRYEYNRFFYSNFVYCVDINRKFFNNVFSKITSFKNIINFSLSKKKSFESLIFLINRKTSNANMKIEYIVSKIFAIIIAIKTRTNEYDIYRKIHKNSICSIWIQKEISIKNSRKIQNSKTKKYIDIMIRFSRDIFEFSNIMRKLCCCKYVKIKLSYVVYIFDKTKQNFL